LQLAESLPPIRRKKLGRLLQLILESLLHTQPLREAFLHAHRDQQLRLKGFDLIPSFSQRR
jgi:hypothetical protein